MKIGSVALSFASVLLLGCHRRSEEPSKTPKQTRALKEDLETVGWLTIKRESPPPDSIGDVNPADLAQYVRDTYKLRPDRRALYAIGEIHRLLGGSHEVESFRFKEERVFIRLGQTEVGEVPALSDYPQLRALLSAWAGRELKLQTIHSAPRSMFEPQLPALSSGSTTKTIEALTRLNELWRTYPGDPGLVEAALKGFVWLALRCRDDLELADPLLGRAFALAALLPNPRSSSAAGDEALLAYLMGYQSAARELAKELPAGDPVRPFVEENLEKTSKAVKAGTGDARARLLELLAIARTGQRRLFESAFEASAPQSATAAFEGALKERDRALAGPLYDGDANHAFYAANFYSGLFGSVEYELDFLSSASGAEEWASRMTNTAAGTATEMKRWAEALVRHQKGQIDTDKLVAETRSLRQIGARPHEYVRQQMRVFDRARLESVTGFLSSLDSRPAHLDGAINAGFIQNYYRPGGDGFLSHLCLVAPRLAPVTTAEAARRNGDRRELVHLATTDVLPALYRAHAATRLTLLPDVDATTFRKTFAVAIAGVRAEHYPVASIVLAFERIGDRRSALPYVDRFMRSQPSGVARANAAALKARLLQGDERLREAWDAVRPAIDSWAFPPMRRGALVLMELGRLADAEALARRCVERYEDSPMAYVIVVEVLCREEKFGEAAALLSENVKRFGWTEWGQLSERMRFQSYKLESLIAALRDKKNIPIQDIAILPIGLAKWGDHRRAFELLSGFGRYGINDFGVQMWAFHELSVLEGKELATRWILKAIPEKNRFARSKGKGEIPLVRNMARMAYREGLFDLLWDLFPEPSPPDDALFGLRAAALIQLSDTSDRDATRRREAIEFFRARPASEFAATARYLLDDLDEPTFLSGVKHEMGDLSTAAWAVGLKRAATGERRESLDWLEASLLAGEAQGYPPADMATRILSYLSMVLRRRRSRSGVREVKGRDRVRSARGEHRNTPFLGVARPGHEERPRGSYDSRAEHSPRRTHRPFSPSPVHPDSRTRWQSTGCARGTRSLCIRRGAAPVLPCAPDPRRPRGSEPERSRRRTPSFRPGADLPALRDFRASPALDAQRERIQIGPCARVRAFFRAAWTPYGLAVPCACDVDGDCDCASGEAYRRHERRRCVSLVVGAAARCLVDSLVAGAGDGGRSSLDSRQRRAGCR